MRRHSHRRGQIRRRSPSPRRNSPTGFNNLEQEAIREFNREVALEEEFSELKALIRSPIGKERDIIIGHIIPSMIKFRITGRKIQDGDYVGLPIHYAVFYDDLDLVRQLGLENILTKDSLGKTALEYAKVPAILRYILVGMSEKQKSGLRRPLCDMAASFEEEDESNIAQMVRAECERLVSKDRLPLAALHSTGRWATAKRRWNNRVAGEAMRRLFPNTTGGRRTVRRRIKQT